MYPESRVSATDREPVPGPQRGEGPPQKQVGTTVQAEVAEVDPPSGHGR